MGLPVVRKYGRTYQSPCPQSRIRTAVAISEIGAEEGGGKRERGKLEKERKGRKERGRLEKERKGRKERGRLGRDSTRGIFSEVKKWRERGRETGRKDGRKERVRLPYDETRILPYLLSFEPRVDHT